MEPITYLMISSLVELTPTWAGRHETSRMCADSKREEVCIQRGSLHMGHEKSGEGLHTDDSKVKAILKTEPPATVSEIKSFFGLAQYCANFVPDFASVTDLLWELTRGDKPFEWRREQEKAFEKVKAMITGALEGIQSISYGYRKW